MFPRTGILSRLAAGLVFGITLLAVPFTKAWSQVDIQVAKDTIKLELNRRSCNMSDEGCKPTDLLVHPVLTCEVNAALPSGSQPWVEFRMPGKPALRMDMDIREVWNRKDRWTITNDGRNDVSRAFIFPGKVPTGTFEFTIGFRNELMETNQVVFEGKGSFLKQLITPGNEETAELLVDDDWKLPIGYLYTTSDRGLHVVTWYRGRPGGVPTFLFYNGKEIAKNEGCGIGGVDEFDPSMWTYWEVVCELTGVYANAEDAANGYEPNFDLSANPGEYEIKCLAAGKLARVIKFTVNPDGSFDNGIAKANTLGSDRVIVPVDVRLDNPKWNRDAWKTAAFYGHPLTGFSAPAPPAPKQ
jgi:hypothetical protein